VYHGEVYSIQQYMIKFVSDVQQDWFSLNTPVYTTNKTEILLKVALNTITLTPSNWFFEIQMKSSIENYVRIY